MNSQPHCAGRLLPLRKSLTAVGFGELLTLLLLTRLFGPGSKQSIIQGVLWSSGRWTSKRLIPAGNWGCATCRCSSNKGLKQVWLYLVVEAHMVHSVLTVPDELGWGLTLQTGSRMGFWNGSREQHSPQAVWSILLMDMSCPQALTTNEALKENLQTLSQALL